MSSIHPSTIRRDIIAAPVTVGKEYPTAVQFSTTTTPAYFGQVRATFTFQSQMAQVLFSG